MKPKQCINCILFSCINSQTKKGKETIEAKMVATTIIKPKKARTTIIAE